MDRFNRLGLFIGRGYDGKLFFRHLWFLSSKEPIDDKSDTGHKYKNMLQHVITQVTVIFKT